MLSPLFLQQYATQRAALARWMDENLSCMNGEENPPTFCPADGTGAEGPPQAIEGAPASDAGMAAAAPGDGNALPVGAYPVDAPDMMGYAAAGHTMEETQHQVAEGVQHEHMMAQQEGVDVAVAPATNLVQH